MKRPSGFHGTMLVTAASLLLASCDYIGSRRTTADSAGAVAAAGGSTASVANGSVANGSVANGGVASTSGASTSTAITDSTMAGDSALRARAPGDSGVPVPTDTVFRQRPDSTGRAKLPTARVRIEVDLAARQLHLFRDSVMVETHPVAVGSTEWPTRTGQWNITQVIWNPEWLPPDESWAEQRKPRKPGDPENPLGRAQLVYDPPRTIHGTNDPKSIGKAVSHGSIRVTNKVAQELAQLLMEETGAGKDSAWYQAAKTNHTVKQVVPLPQLVPIRVY